MFEQFNLGKKGFREVLQGEAAFDGWVVEMGLLEHVEEVEDLIANFSVLDDFVAE